MRSFCRKKSGPAGGPLFAPADARFGFAAEPPRPASRMAALPLDMS